jgi:hypothetical protein
MAGAFKLDACPSCCTPVSACPCCNEGADMWNYNIQVVISGGGNLDGTYILAPYHFETGICEWTLSTGVPSCNVGNWEFFIMEVGVGIYDFAVFAYYTDGSYALHRWTKHIIGKPDCVSLLDACDFPFSTQDPSRVCDASSSTCTVTAIAI